MSSRVYLCANCGAIRRSPAVYLLAPRQAWAEAEATARWPKHCRRPMKPLSFVQAEAATQLNEQERVKWVSAGMHVLRQRQHGKHKWKAVTADWQIKEVKRQRLAFIVASQERARLCNRRMPARAKEKLIEKRVSAALAKEI